MANGKSQTQKEQKNTPIIREKALRRNWQNIQNINHRKTGCLWPNFTELKHLIIFLLFNAVILFTLEHYPLPPVALKTTLGMAPPLLWVNIACLTYFFTEFVLVLCRERKINSDRFAIKQQFFMAAFYLFFWYLGELQQHFTILLIGGFFLQLLEAFARKNPFNRALAD